MKCVIFAALIWTISLLPAVAAASDRSDIVRVVQAFNSSATKEIYQSYCTSDAIIIDHVAPLMFAGPKACESEWDAVGAWASKYGFAFNSIVQRLYEPTFLSIAGDHAYAVFPGRAWFNYRGRKETERLYVTFLLRREAGGWRIETLTYSSLGWKPDASIGR